MSAKRRLIAALLTGTMLAGAEGAALAQEQPQQGSGQTTSADLSPAQAANTLSGDEIIVTAQKRSENLQNVPISIQALGTQKLEQLNIANFNEYTRQLPSVSFQTLQPGSTSVYVRGVASGGDGNHSGSLPSVGVYLDEQPITTIGGTLDVHVYDIARIEQLSGPQGTLYGASSESGTIRIITNKPDPSGFAGAINVEGNTVEKGSQGGKIEGFVNLPISEGAAIRLVGFYEHDAGYIDNVPGTRTFCGTPTRDAMGNINGCNLDGLSFNNSRFVKKDYNDVDVAGGRAALRIELNDNWTATATAFGQDQHNHGSFGADLSLGDLQVQHFLPEYQHDRYLQAALTIEGKIGSWDLTYAGAYLWRKVSASNDYTDYAEAYDNLYFSYGGLANYFYYQDNAGNNILPVQQVVGRDRFNKLSQELRISSPADQPIRLVAGLFYQRQFHFIHQDYEIAGLGSQVSVNGLPGTLWLTQQDRVDRDYAAFGEASWDIVPTLTLTGGLRYYKFDNSLIGFFGFGRNPAGQPFNAAGSSRTGVAGCYNTDGSIVRDNPGGTLFPPAVAGSPCTDLADFEGGKLVPKRNKHDGFIHRLNLTWKATPDHMLYATWSRGFRPGGINRRGDIPPYAADYLTNYELGFKTRWLDRAMHINGALFWQDWKNFQYSFLGQNSFTEIHNGPNARIKGVELDVGYSRSGLSLNAAATYVDGKTREDTCVAVSADPHCGDPGNVAAPSGTRLPVTPKFKITGTARYDWTLTGATKAHVQGNVTHQSSTSSDLRVAQEALLGKTPEWTLFDFAAGLDIRSVSIEAFIENAFDKRAQLTRFVECGNCYQRPYAYFYTPRTIGIRAGYKF